MERNQFKVKHKKVISIRMKTCFIMSDRQHFIMFSYLDCVFLIIQFQVFVVFPKMVEQNVRDDAE